MQAHDSHFKGNFDRIVISHSNTCLAAKEKLGSRAVKNKVIQDLIL